MEKTEIDSPSSSDQGTPSYYKWATNLHNLLHDSEGTELFQQYLKQENHDSRSLDFWFASEGFKRMDDKVLPNAIKIINRNYICGSLDISQETKLEISKKIATNTGLDKTIFDKAQEEVETVITKTTYPNFLRSDIYIQYMQNISVCHSPINERRNLSWTDPIPQKTDHICELKDTERPIDITTSRESLDLLQTVYEDSELQILNFNNNNEVNIVSTNNNNFCNPLTRKSVFKWSKLTNTIGKLKPESQAGHYLKHTTPGYNTCYTKYSAYLPPSAQDSELQSLSSDVQTDDTMSMVSSSTNDSDYYSTCRQTRPRRTIKTKHGTPFNKDELPAHCSFIPRTERLPENISLPMRDFAKILTDKLNKVLDDRRLKECLEERLERVNSKLEFQVECPLPPPQPIPNAEPNFECPQEILDNHMLRVFDNPTNQNASPSPGCLTPSAPPPVEVPTARRNTTVPKSRKSSSTHTNWRHLTMERNSPPYPAAVMNNHDMMMENPVYGSRGLYNSQHAFDSSMGLFPHQYSDNQILDSRKQMEFVKQKLKKTNRKSYPATNASTSSSSSTSSNDMISIAYCYGRDTVPFLCRMQGKIIVLKQFKSLLSKKGNFRYFFKKVSEEFGGIVFEEITDDHEVLPLWEGKVFCLIECE